MPIDSKDSPIVELYKAIPELSERELDDFKSFQANDNEWLFERTQAYFRRSIIDALRNPKWLVNLSYPIYSDFVKRNNGRPAPQHDTLQRYNIENLIAEYKDPMELAKAIDEHELNYFRGMEPDVVARTIELMGERHSKLAFFRGTWFDQQEKFTGIDFAPGLLSEALSYATGRKQAVIAMVKFVDVGRLYAEHKITIGTENNWWRNSLELQIYDPKALDSFTIRRLPTSEQRIEEIKRAANIKGIRV